MASRTARLIAAATVIVMGALLPATASAGADNHMVGDMLGWNLGVNYDDWLSYNDYVNAGDFLEFVYKLGDHNVVNVDEESYELCAPLIDMQMWNSGHDIVQLPEPGTYFFICDIADHCDQGMKLAITAI